MFVSFSKILPSQICYKKNNDSDKKKYSPNISGFIQRIAFIVLWVIISNKLDNLHSIFTILCFSLRNWKITEKYFYKKLKCSRGLWIELASTRFIYKLITNPLFCKRFNWERKCNQENLKQWHFNDASSWIMFLIFLLSLSVYIYEVQHWDFFPHKLIKLEKKVP